MVGEETGESTSEVTNSHLLPHLLRTKLFFIMYFMFLGRQHNSPGEKGLWVEFRGKEPWNFYF